MVSSIMMIPQLKHRHLSSFHPESNHDPENHRFLRSHTNCRSGCGAIFGWRVQRKQLQPFPKQLLSRSENRSRLPQAISVYLEDGKPFVIERIGL